MKGSYWAPSVNGNGTVRSTRTIGIASSHVGDSDGMRTFARHSLVGALADALPDARAFVGLGRQIAIKLISCSMRSWAWPVPFFIPASRHVWQTARPQKPPPR